MTPRLNATFNPGIPECPSKQELNHLTKGESEIFLAVNYINKLQADLGDALEKLAVKLNPVMRQPYPQEACQDNMCDPLKQTELGRILQDSTNRMNLHISFIKELNDRTCL